MVEFEAEIDESSSFRTEPFTAMITNFEVKEIGDYNKVVIEFDEGPFLTIFPPKKIVNGKVPGYQDLGIFIKSLASHGIKTIIDVDPDLEDLIGIRTEPDIVGHEASFDVNVKEWTNNQGELKKNYQWSISKIDIGKTEQKTTEKPNETKTDSNYEDLKLELTDVLMKLLEKEPRKEVDIMRGIKQEVTDKTHAEELNKVRKQVLSELVAENVLVEEKGYYTLV